MAKRFIDTDIFKKRFVKGLKAPYKLLWLYILNDCNHAGIYEVEIEIAILRIGCSEITEEGALLSFGEKIVVFDGGTKWFIPSFIEFQYGQLSENNRAHTGIISLLSKYNLIDQNLKIKPLASPLQGDKEMEMEMEQDMETDKVKKREPKTEEVFQALQFHFGISEMKFNLFRELDSFVMVLQSKNQIEEFIEQFKAYQEYKTKSEEKAHNFKGFIGTIEKLYMDGGWCADNWIHKRDNLKINGKSEQQKRTDEVEQLKFEASERLRNATRQ